MTSKLKKSILICMVAFMGIAIMTACGHDKLGSSHQSDYPTLPPPALISEVPLGLSDLVRESSLIVDATVSRVLQDEELEFVPKKGSTDEKLSKKAGMTKDKFTVRPIELRINETLKGHAEEEGKKIMMYITPVALEISPKFKEGDRLVFMLNPYSRGGYTAVALQDGYYYIAEDERIYPANLTQQLKKESGKTLKDFKKEIKSLS